MLSSETTTTWVVPTEAAGERLDRHVADHLEITRSRAQKWVRAGHVTVDGKLPKVSLSLGGGEQLAATQPPEQDTRIEPEEGPLEVLAVDSDYVVIDKPAGLAVHPGAVRRSGTLVHRLLARFPDIATVGGAERPGIVHRLDLDTTGVMVIARTEAAYLHLQQQFAERTVAKEYLAVAYGRFREPTGVIDAPLGRHRSDRTKMTVDERSGRPARTRYRVHSEYDSVSLVRVRLDTGRTHQVRVHLKHVGRPLVGDPTYGEQRWKNYPGSPRRRALAHFPRPALHAWRLGFEHPTRGAFVDFEAPPPADLAELWHIWSDGQTLALEDVGSLPEE